MVAYIKQQISGAGRGQRGGYRERIIRGAMEEFDVQLSDEDVAKLVELMDKSQQAGYRRERAGAAGFGSSTRS